MPMKPKEMVKLLQKNGFVKKSHRKTSHLKMYNEASNLTVTVPIHAKELGKGLEHAILKEAGLK